jgi:hypothetical protein
MRASCVWCCVALVLLLGAAHALGPPGPPGGDVQLCGDWSALTAYAPLDIVTYVPLQQSYLCLLANTNQQPDISPTYWQLVLDHGQGGPPGSKGIKGARRAAFTNPSSHLCVCVFRPPWREWKSRTTGHPR